MLWNNERAYTTIDDTEEEEEEAEAAKQGFQYGIRRNWKYTDSTILRRVYVCLSMRISTPRPSASTVLCVLVLALCEFWWDAECVCLDEEEDERGRPSEEEEVEEEEEEDWGKVG